MKVLAFGASSSKQSINQILAGYAARLIEGAKVETLDLNDFELPLFSEDKEKEIGSPKLAQNFIAKMKCADAIIVSFAEHNGTYTAAFKNILDWASRVTRDVYQNKPVVFLSTSPGPGGASSVLKTAVESGHFFGAKVVSQLSVPSFYDNFDMTKQDFSNQQIKDALVTRVNGLISQ